MLAPLCEDGPTLRRGISHERNPGALTPGPDHRRGLLLTIVAVESGGLYMLRIVRRQVDLTGFQQAFARTFHAHAGVLVIFGLVCQSLADNITLDQPLAAIARSGVPWPRS